MKLQTPVETDRSRLGLSLDDKIMVIGSCFADNAGKKMTDIGLDAAVNPFGTLYNPSSLRSSVQRLADPVPFTAADCIQMGSGSNLVCSFSHHTAFARKTQEEFLENANARLLGASSFFKECNVLILTLGTVWCFKHLPDGKTVSNCLKRDAKEFERIRLGIDECTTMLEDIVRLCPEKKIFITVSPIRHLKDGANENQLSKSTLLLAADSLCRKFDNCEYFPAYEIVMDELRDYRFYAEDMTHPSAQTVNYIWERFCDFAVPDNEKDRLKNLEKDFRRSCHIQITGR